MNLNHPTLCSPCEEVNAPPPVTINQTVIPQVETVKCLGIHFDRRLPWKNHVSTKRKQLDHKTREIKWLIGRHSPLSLENKILIYKTVLIPVWTYGIKLWGCASNSNIETIQRYQSKLLRTITNASWYVTNHNLHSNDTWYVACVLCLHNTHAIYEVPFVQHLPKISK
jgi:hypothetical protein